MMYRFALNYLNKWLQSSDRKPIILRGARQVGKTHTVRELAQINGMHLVELNFEKQKDILSLFESNDPKKIISHLEALYSVNINTTTTILFLDEIQAAPEVLAKLRWFAEDLPELAVVAAGSLLDFVLSDHNFSMPVGRITYLYMNPLSFDEFLLVNEKSQLYELMQNFTLKEHMPPAIHNQLIDLFKEYTLVGGMPAAVYSWKQNKSFSEVQRIHLDLLSSYRDDFAKYAGRASIDRLDDILLAIPRMLGKKFIFSHINKDVKAAALRQALDLLTKARVCTQVFATHANGLPLMSEANNKTFKVNFLDIGLVASQLGLGLHQLKNTADLNLINNGAIAEQMVGQLLLTIEPFYIDPSLCYWVREERSSNAEIDYVIQHANQILPVEVKSGHSGSMRSLHLFMQQKQLDLAIRINTAHPVLEKVETNTHLGVVNYNLLSIPMYMIGQLKRLLQSI